METPLAVLGAVLLLCACAAQQDCPAPLASTARLTLTSRRNLTGHWSVQVRLEHGAAPGSQDGRAGPWRVAVDHGTARCEAGETVFVEATLTAPAPRPGPDYEMFPGVGYFKYHPQAAVWEAARDTCLREGAHLAIVNSTPESQYMAQVLAQHKSGVAYLGFHDRFVEGSFVTVLGTPLNTTGFTQWADQRLPDNGGNIPEPGADCGAIYKNGGLHDIACSTALPFFCERALW